MEKQYEKKITWTIKNFSTLQSQKVYSDNFVVGDSKWRLRAYPKGNGDGINKCFSLFLEVADSESLPYGWKRQITHRLTVVNQISEKLSQQKEYSSSSMEKQYEKKITWTIKNFSTILVVACRRLVAYPKGNGDGINKYLSLFLEVADSESLPYGWKRHTKFRLTVVNQISEKLSQQRGVSSQSSWFDQKSPNLGYTAMLPLIDENDGFLVNGEVKIVAEVSVLKVVGKSDVLQETLLVNESMDVNGFQVLPSQVESVNSLFKKHPDIASQFCLKNPHLRTTYLNSLLSLTEILCKSPEKLSIDDLANAYSTLTCLTKAGFKLDWLENKLKEVGQTRVQEIEALLEFLR